MKTAPGYPDVGDERAGLPVEAAHRVDVGHPERVAHDRHALGRVEGDLVATTGDELQRVDRAVGLEPADVAVVVLAAGAAVDVGDEPDVLVGVPAGGLGGLEAIHRLDHAGGRAGGRGGSGGRVGGRGVIAAGPSVASAAGDGAEPQDGEEADDPAMQLDRSRHEVLSVAGESYSSGAPPARATWSSRILPASNRRAEASILSIVSSNSAFAPRLNRIGLIRATTKARR